MNNAWSIDLEENEQELILVESYRIAVSLGFEADYEQYEKLLNAIINDPFDLFYEIAKSKGYQSDLDEFRAEFHFLIYQNALKAVGRKR